MSAISLVLPTLNGEGELPGLLEALGAQTRPAREIVVVDSSSDDNTCEVAASYPGVRVVKIARDEFNHGLTRDFALRQTTGDCVATDGLRQSQRVWNDQLQPYVPGRWFAQRDGTGQGVRTAGYRHLGGPL
ncbi:glycosyltransferase family 2 protein [Granulimonas faecalis]|uniref:glycosyltransferase family 2 protein n=1 Tax=Granulimonas faecalis TaxID=2894155 RepID=UPI003518352B